MNRASRGARVIGIAVLVLAAGCATPEGGAQASRAPRFHVTGGSTTGPLRAERVELAFGNGLGEATVSKNERLEGKAVIRFAGNGPFRAQWKVDGRVIETVNLLVSYGSTLTLSTAEATVLPTFEPGPHELALEILQPVPGFRVPPVRYFVTMEKPRK